MRWIFLAAACLTIIILAYFRGGDSQKLLSPNGPETSSPSKAASTRTNSKYPPIFNNLEASATSAASAAPPFDSMPFNPAEWPTVTPQAEFDAAALALATIVPLLDTVRPAAPSAAAILPAPNDERHPFVETLREIKEIERQNPNNLLPGIVRRGQSAATSQEELALEKPAQTARPIATPSTRLSGQARGYTMLYLMHQRARATVEKQVQAMLQSEVSDLYLGVLVDGTFGKDYVYLADVVRRLASDGRSLTLVLYLSNGPGMRRSEDSEYSSAGFNTIDPEEFRYLIRRDPSTRAKFLEILRETKPVFLLNLALNVNNKNFAIPMLEDNLDRESFKAIKDLAEPELRDVAEILRNPCLNCFDGNDAETFGAGSELHSPYDIGKLGIRDGYSLDGYGYRFADEEPGKPLDLPSVKQFISQSLTNGVMYFGLWRADRQGVVVDGVLPPPDERTYAVPNDLQIAAEIELLRHGL